MAGALKKAPFGTSLPGRGRGAGSGAAQVPPTCAPHVCPQGCGSGSATPGHRGLPAGPHLTFWVGFHRSEGSSPLWGSSTGGWRMEMHTSPVCPGTGRRGHCLPWRPAGRTVPPATPLRSGEERAHLVDVGVPHLGQETKSRRGIGVVDGELEACLWGGQRRGAQMGPAVCSAPRVGTGWPAQAAAPTAPTSTRKRPSAWEGRPRHGRAAQRAGAVCTLARNTTHQPRPSRAWPGAGRLPGGRLSWLGSVGACPGRSSGPECGPGL